MFLIDPLASEIRNDKLKITLQYRNTLLNETYWGSLFE